MCTVRQKRKNVAVLGFYLRFNTQASISCAFGENISCDVTRSRTQLSFNYFYIT